MSQLQPCSYADNDLATTPASKAEALNKQFYSLSFYKGR